MNRKRKSTLSSGSVSKNIKQNDREYIVERILDRRVRNGKIEYLLKWQGYSNAFNSWEPESNCNFAGLDDFNNRFDEEQRKNEEYGFNSNRDSDETSLSSSSTNNNSNFKPKSKHNKKSLNSPSSSSNHNSILDSSNTSISTNLNKSKSSIRSLNGDQSSESSHDSSFILNDDSVARKSGKTINRLEMNYPVELIYGATETTNGELMYLVKWKNLNGAELVNGQALEKRQPQVVLQFFRSNFKFK